MVDSIVGQRVLTRSFGSRERGRLAADTLLTEHGPDAVKRTSPTCSSRSGHHLSSTYTKEVSLAEALQPEPSTYTGDKRQARSISLLPTSSASTPFRSIERH